MDEMIYRQELRENVSRCPFLTQLNGKKILITGGTGLIGKELVDTLAEYEEQNHTGIEIYVMSRHGKGIEKRFPDLVKREWFHYLEQDVSMPLFIDAPIEYILHCAGKGDPKSMTEDPVGILDANIIGTKQILQFAARQKNSRVLYLSSGEVYGILSTVDSKGIIESNCGKLDSLNVRNCYGIAKRAGESMCASFLSEYGVDVRIARPAHIYGMTAMENESRVVFQFLKQAAGEKDIILKSAGLQKRSWTYLADAVVGILAVLFLGEKGEAYNVSNTAAACSIRKLAEMIAEEAGVHVIQQGQNEQEQKGNSGIMNAVLSNEKLKSLGVEMRYDVKAGVKRWLI